MADVPEQGAAVEVSIPEDFAKYEEYRRTGKLPEAEKPEAAKETSEAPAEKPEAETGSESETEQEGEREKPKKEGGFQRRIKQLTDRIKDLEGKLAVPAGATETKPGETTDKEPNLADFDTYEDFQKAEREYLKKQLRTDLLNELKAEREKEKQAEQERTVADTWNQKVEAARKVHDDYDEVFESAEMPKSAVLRAAIVNDPNGAELAYTLAKQPEVLQRMDSLDPIQQALEIGRMSAKLDPVQGTKPATTKAPKPPATVSGGKAPEITPYTAQTFADYERVRMEQLRRR